MDWSPAPQLSLEKLANLQANAPSWCQAGSVDFYMLRPEDDQQLNAWYKSLFNEYPQFALHGHGWGPFWWVKDGKIVDCESHPYAMTDVELRERSIRALCEATR